MNLNKILQKNPLVSSIFPISLFGSSLNISSVSSKVYWFEVSKQLLIKFYLFLLKVWNQIHHGKKHSSMSGRYLIRTCCLF